MCKEPGVGNFLKYRRTFGIDETWWVKGRLGEDLFSGRGRGQIMWGCLGPVLHDCWEAVGVFTLGILKSPLWLLCQGIDSRKARRVQEDQYSQC